MLVAKPNLRAEILSPINVVFGILLVASLALSLTFAGFSAQREERSNRITAIKALASFTSTQLYYYDTNSLREVFDTLAKGPLFDRIEVVDRYGSVVLFVGSDPNTSEPSHRVPLFHEGTTKLGELAVWNSRARLLAGNRIFLWAVNALMVSLLFGIVILFARRHWETHLLQPLNFFMDSLANSPDRIDPSAFKTEELSAIATEFQTLHQRLDFAARCDQLTGLGNRRAMDMKLEQLIEVSTTSMRDLAILFIDTDNFKQINDTFGHATGDSFLKLIGSRLSELADEQTHVFRFGGDEFVILSLDCSKADAMDLSDRVQSVFETPTEINGSVVRSSCSIGIAICPDDAQTAETLLISADTSVYDAKRLGRRRTTIFNDDLASRNRETLKNIQRVDDVLHGQGQRFHQQSIVTGSSQNVWGCELLLRLPDLRSSNKVVPAEKVVHAIRKLGKLRFLGNLILAYAVSTVQSEQSVVSINFAPDQLRDASILPEFRKAARKLGGLVGMVVVEITEEGVQSGSQLIDNVHAISSMGFRIALDDFGTGYSSLVCIRQLPLDIIKQDKSLLWAKTDKGADDKLFEATVGIARNFDCKVVAEGVETQEHFDCAVPNGCDLLQGYWVDKYLGASHQAA